MKKDDIIQNLCEQNEQLKQQIQFWKQKYHRLKDKYKQLKQSKQNNGHLHHSDSIQSPEKRDIRMEETNLFAWETSIQATEVSPQKEQSPPKLPINNEPQPALQNQPQSGSKKKLQMKGTLDGFDFFSKDMLSPPKLDKNTCELIEGCFIIQKNSSIDHFDPIRLVHPQNKYVKIRSMFDIIYRYIFVNDNLVQILDDEFDSRKNQIMFGSPCQDFQFVFDNLNEKQGEKGRINAFEIGTNLMRKRYVYGIVMPQIVQTGDKYYETQVAYGFMSHVPFPNFFKDLNRIVQQQIKYKMLNMNKNTVRKSQKIEIIAYTIQHITNRSLENNLVVTDYPVNLELKANICGLKLIYTNKNSYISDQFNHIESLLPKFSLKKIVKLVHYVLAEQSCIIVCKNRKKLNQIFEVVRTIIYPFNWIFPIIYFYSDFFQPFLNSPLPILIGHIHNDSPGEEDDKNGLNKSQLPENDFIKIYIEEQNKKDENQPQGYEKHIKDIYKKLFKDKKSQSSTPNKNISHLQQKPISQRTTTKIFQYIKKLRIFIQTGQIEEEMDDFLIQFMDTQMVSYYKQTRNSSAQ